MWYKAAKFQNEELAGKLYNRLQPAMFKHNIDITVFRLVFGGIWIVIVLNDTQPSLLIENEALTYLHEGTLTEIPQNVLTALMERRHSQITYANRKTGGGLAYESHTPTPVPYASDTPIPEKDIEATFKETLQYLSKDVPPTYHNIKKQMTGKKPFIIEYDETSNQTSTDKFEELMRGKLTFNDIRDKLESKQVISLINGINTERLKVAMKYRYTDSAIRLHNAVQSLNTQVKVSEWLEKLSTHIWIEFETMLPTSYGNIKAIYFNNACPFNEIDKVVPPHINRYMNETLKQTYTVHMHQYSLDIIDENGTDIFDFTYDSLTDKWVYLASHICPTNTCTYNASRISDLHTIGVCTPCTRCKDATNYFVSWFHTALKVINKEYAVSTTPDDFKQQVTEYETIANISVGKGKNKRTIKQNVKRNINYTIVTFDVSTRYIPVSPYETHIKKDNWLTLHGTDDLIYVRRHIGEVKRRYAGSHFERLKKRILKEGTILEDNKIYELEQTQEGELIVTGKVTEHDKYVPMLRDKERKTIKKVVASQYE